MSETGEETTIDCPACKTPSPRSFQYCISCGAGLHGQASRRESAFMPYSLQAEYPPLNTGQPQFQPYDNPLPPQAPYVIMPQPYQPAPSEVEKYLLPINRTILSIVCGYLGLFCLLLWPLGIVTAPLSACALYQLKQRPEKLGRGRAIFGLVAGLIGTVAFLVILALQSA